MSELEVNPELVRAVGQLYKVLGDTTRLRILVELIESEVNVGGICEALELEQSTVSHQLRVLRKHGMVSSRREGKIVYYSLDDEHVKDILIQTFKHVKHIKNE